jgi:outer membrane cobalamin receptor
MVVLPAVAVAQVPEQPTPQPTDSGPDVADLSLESLLDTPVEVTKDARSTRDAASVLLVMNRDEILASGARDLLEVLQLVPGFTFHQDVQGVVGIAFRGLWGNEGKVLVMLDGQEINELLYTGPQFGHHVLVHQIERVEIIRGPGSALYGGTAGLSVINVVSRGGKDLQGGAFGARQAVGVGGVHDWSLGASFGGKHESNGLEWSLHAVGGQGRRTTGTFDDFYGGSTSLATDPLDPFFITAGASWKGLKARLLYDDHAVGATVGFGAGLPGQKMRFRTAVADVSYEWKVSDTLTIKPRLNARLHLPWQNLDRESELFYDKTAMRFLAGVGATWNAASFLTVSGGLEGHFDHAWLNEKTLYGAQTQFGDQNQVSYGNVGAWVQGQLTTDVVNVTAGGRLEVHSQVGVNVAPRVALTRQFDKVNVKLLYGGAFRSPGIENLNLSMGLVRAERTHVAEAEVGVQLGDVGFVSVNGFYTLLVAPITYAYDPDTDTESYRNAGAISTAGGEALLKLRGSFGHLNLSYSLAVPVVAEDVDTYLVPGRERPTLLGMPTHKATLSGKLILHKHFSLGGSAVFLSDRYAFTSATELLDGVGMIGRVPESFLLTAWLGFDAIGNTGLSAQFGVGNLLDAKVPFVQPYDGGLAPMPGRGREFFLRITYAMEFLK